MKDLFGTLLLLLPALLVIMEFYGDYTIWREKKLNEAKNFVDNWENYYEKEMKRK